MGEKTRLGVAVLLAVTLSITQPNIEYAKEFPLEVLETQNVQTIQDKQEWLDASSLAIVTERERLAVIAEIEQRAAIEHAQAEVRAEQLVVDLTDYEYDLLVHLVNAEAGEDGIQSKIGVANVVFNRMKSTQFPNSLRSVIYQKYQFEVTSNGSINKTPSAESYEAVDRALRGENPVGNCLYFWASYLDSHNSIWQQDVYCQYDSTVFGR